MGPDIIIYVVVVVGIILISMTLHEAMHAFVSYWLGDDTAKLQGRLTLNPIKHIDPFLTILLPLGLLLVGLPPFGGAKPVPFNPDRVKGGDWGAALVALGGPLTNLLLAFIIYGIGVLIHPEAGTLGATIIALGVQINLGFFIFNILPFPPLDGSRVLYAIAPDFIRTGMRAIERYGIFVVFILVLVFSPYIGAFMTGAIDFFINLFSQIFRG
jgi:Zn-dependent protease